MKKFVIYSIAILIALCLTTLSGCRKDSASTANQNGTSDESGIPILLGKNFEEVKGILGTPDGARENPLRDGISRISWSYGNFPDETAETAVYFEDNSVKSVGTLFFEPNFSPVQMVPKEIMKATPTEYRATSSLFMIIWRLDGNSHIVVVRDENNVCSKLEEQVDTQTGQLLQRYVLVNGGKKWPNQKIYGFGEYAGNPSVKELIGGSDAYLQNFPVDSE